jgi:hypothetical protein
VLRLGDGSGPPALLSVGGPEEPLIADRLAFAAVDLVRTADLTQLRACPLPEGGCGWLFLDLSRNRSRRWCAMEDCGTQAKSRRLTDRRRSTRATTTTRPLHDTDVQRWPARYRSSAHAVSIRLPARIRAGNARPIAAPQPTIVGAGAGLPPRRGTDSR